QQPMHSPDGRYTLITNGEIYNYLELRQKLAGQGVAFHTSSDTEVLLQMLIHEGEGALGQLNGMFAFAFFDGRTGDWMLCRDPFGIKPLYYAEAGDELIFASEIKAILAHPAIAPAADEAALHQYLSLQFCLNGRTLFRGIHKIEAGCFLKGGRDRAPEMVRYWDTNYHIDEHHTEEYFRDRLLWLLEDSARLQIRSDVPLGAYLSGGLDSSIVASTAAEHLGGSFPVFHGRFDAGPQYDESAYAKSAATTMGAEYLEVVPTAQDFVDLLPGIIYAMDEPAAGPGVFPQHMVSRMAAERVKVVLGGTGGDEVFGGYARYLVGYLEQALKGAIFETQEEGKHVVTLASIVPNLPILQQYAPLMQHFWRDGLFGDMDARYFRLIDRSPDLEHLLAPDALAAFDREAVFAEFRTLFNHPDTQSYVNKMTHFDLKALLPALLQVEDRASMAVGLESRVPLLDTRIVDLVTSMPPAMKFQGGHTKHILKNAACNLIPPALRERKDKMGFPVPLKEWMAGGPVRDFVRDTLFSQASRERGLLRPEALETLLAAETAGGRQLWGALCLELWHREFIDAS
ncbi:asparagine synthase (glutamine-hydrolyzing), partial [bacterium]|nr:asparagine synthase (glutamine-hydrolyzing) [bacterium]